MTNQQRYNLGLGALALCGMVIGTWLFAPSGTLISDPPLHTRDIMVPRTPLNDCAKCNAGLVRPRFNRCWDDICTVYDGPTTVLSIPDGARPRDTCGCPYGTFGWYPDGECSCGTVTNLTNLTTDNANLAITVEAAREPKDWEPWSVVLSYPDSTCLSALVPMVESNVECRDPRYVDVYTKDQRRIRVDRLTGEIER